MSCEFEYGLLIAIAGAQTRFGPLYTNDDKAELTIVVTVVICRPAHKYVRMQRPLFGMSEMPQRGRVQRLLGLGLVGEVRPGRR